jgi:NAD-dependent dihydropyrimidine dehydrogenase PreA subunit
VEQAVFESDPLHELAALYPKAFPLAHKLDWLTFLAVGPEWNRSLRRARGVAKTRPTTPPRPLSPEELTERVRAKARELGISTIGVAPFDPLYTYEEWRDEVATQGDRVIVCVLEKHFDATQVIPGARASIANIGALVEDTQLATKLAEYVIELGYRATPSAEGPKGLIIPYAVAAGLGQLGLNGQLLTPVAGPRIVMATVQTDAPLTFDKPVDYGVEKICDECKVCVRRCPVKAIPSRRALYRGVMKAKINTPRCFATVLQSEGCAICQKVCPIQKYGLAAVQEEYRRTGRILGKDTDDLEGYDWIDGYHYGPGVRPTMPRSFFEMPALEHTGTIDPGWRSWEK